MLLTQNQIAQEQIQKINNNLEEKGKIQECYAYAVDNSEITYKKLNEDDTEETKIIKEILNV
jgi:hypothetical protein